MKKEEINYSIGKLKDAVKRLEEGIEKSKDELDKDGVIQRFEFSYEILWKTLKIFLRYKGIEVKSPRDTFKEAFKFGLIDEEDRFLNMIEDRNKTSHIYDSETSKKIFERIKRVYIKVIKEE